MWCVGVEEDEGEKSAEVVDRTGFGEAQGYANDDGKDKSGNVIADPPVHMANTVSFDAEDVDQNKEDGNE